MQNYFGRPGGSSHISSNFQWVLVIRAKKLVKAETGCQVLLLLRLPHPWIFLNIPFSIPTKVSCSTFTTVLSLFWEGGVGTEFVQAMVTLMWLLFVMHSSNMPSQAILATELFETLVTVIWLFSWMY
jgi:hypothetical protein